MRLSLAYTPVILLPMFNVGGPELFALVVLVMLLFDPRDLPGVMKKLVRTWRTVRDTTQGVQSEFLSTLNWENPEKLPVKERKPRIRKATPEELEAFRAQPEQRSVSAQPAAEQPAPDSID